MSSRVTWRGRGLNILARVITAAAVVFCCLVAVADILAGRGSLAAMMLFLAVVNGALFTVNTGIALKRKAEAIERSRPRPDYAHIARMEREVYGEAFHHDGAPAPREPVKRSIVISEASRGAVTCERGYHIFSYNDPACLDCGEKI